MERLLAECRTKKHLMTHTPKNEMCPICLKAKFTESRLGDLIALPERPTLKIEQMKTKSELDMEILLLLTLLFYHPRKILE